MMDEKVEPYSELLALKDKELPSKSCYYTVPGFLVSNSRKLFSALCRFSLSREKQWLKVRL